jgi:hypothetical protein
VAAGWRGNSWQGGLSTLVFCTERRGVALQVLCLWIPRKPPAPKKFSHGLNRGAFRMWGFLLVAYILLVADASVSEDRLRFVPKKVGAREAGVGAGSHTR